MLDISCYLTRLPPLRPGKTPGRPSALKFFWIRLPSGHTGSLGGKAAKSSQILQEKYHFPVEPKPPRSGLSSRSTRMKARGGWFSTMRNWQSRVFFGISTSRVS